ncbi:MAG: hypothetical protein ABIV36_07905 [Sphingobium limneticum]
MTVVWEVIAFLGALVGGWLVLTSIGSDYSAPQTAAQAAVGIGIAAVPYFIASMAQRSEISRRLKNLSQDEQGVEQDTLANRVKDFLVGRD